MTLSQFDLTGRVAVVTGAASGIGRGTAVALGGAGATVVLADVDEGGLKETADLVGPGATVAPTDVTQQSDVARLVEGAAADHGRLDVVANIAGIILTNKIVDTSEAELDRVLAVNLKGVFFGCQAGLRVMGQRGGGSIINMASAAIDHAAEGLVCYAMSKAAVAMLTRTAATEGGPLGVRVNAIAPGFIVTPMTQRHARRDDGSLDNTVMDQVIKTMGTMSPLKTVGEPSDIANAVVYLASDAARFVTGTTMRVNGGVAMPW
jgi:3-oxoacyl-[acyl-carrier protein] reductase